MTTLSDLFNQMFPTPTPELLARLTELDELYPWHDMVAAEIVDIRATLGTLTVGLDDIRISTANIVTAINRINDELHPPAPPPPTPDTITIGPAASTSSFTPGWVHTNQDTTVIDDARASILATAAPWQGQHMHGFGAPEIQKVAGGPIDWSGIDRVFGPPAHPETGYMRGAQRRFLYTCGAPAYMKVPKTGTTLTQSYPIGDPALPFKYEPPHRSWYDESADLIAKIVARNPQITDCTGWNELKYFWGNGKWAIEDYTEWFNKVAAKVHAVNPNVRMWAPYCIFITLGWSDKTNWDPNLFGKWGHADKRITTALDYFIRNQSGAYGLALDVRNSNRDTFQNYSDAPTFLPAEWALNPTKGVDPSYWPDDPFSSWSKLDDLMSWIRQRSTLPVMMMELYANGIQNVPNTLYPNAYVSSVEELTAIAAEGLRKLTTAGYSGGMFWRPQGDANGRANPLALYDSTGKATSMAPICAGFTDHFGPGVQLYDVAVDNPGVRGIVSDTTLTLINTTSTPVDVRFGGTLRTLAPFDVAAVAR